MGNFQKKKTQKTTTKEIHKFQVSSYDKNSKTLNEQTSNNESKSTPIQEISNEKFSPAPSFYFGSSQKLKHFSDTLTEKDQIKSSNETNPMAVLELLCSICDQPAEGVCRECILKRFCLNCFKFSHNLEQSSHEFIPYKKEDKYNTNIFQKDLVRKIILKRQRKRLNII